MMSAPLQGASNSGLPQPQERQENKRQSNAAVSGKHVAAENHDKHLATADTEIPPGKVLTARAAQTVYPEMDTGPSSQGNPSARHFLSVESGNNADQRPRLKGTSPEALEPNNVRLQIKILKNAVIIVEKKMHEASQHSPRNLSKLLDSIQECYIKCWRLQRLFTLWQPPPSDIKTEQVNRLISEFENRFVHFLMLCMPPFQDQLQDIFFMCVWYLSCKEMREQRDTANFLHICRKSASLFFVSPFNRFDQALALERLRRSTSQNNKFGCDDLSLLLFRQLTMHSLPCSFYSIHSDRIVANIRKQLHTDPLFQGKWKESHFVPALAEEELTTDAPSALNAFDGSLTPPDQAADYEFSLTKYVMQNIGFTPYRPSSPAIAVTALGQIYRNMQLSDIHEDVCTRSRKFTQRTDPYNQTFYALLQFLAGDNSDTNILHIVNDDLVFYLHALIHYLKAQWPEAEKLAEKSQWPEARWLLGHLCYRRGDLGGAIVNIQKAVDLGVDSALLQLANLLLKSLSPDPERLENLLSKAIDYHRDINGDTLARRIHYFTSQLQLEQEWQGDELASPSTGKKKSKGRGKKRSPIRPPAPEHLTRPRLAQVNLLCIEAMGNQDYDWALQLLVDASQKVNWDFQRASLAIMDLWRLTEMSRNIDYLHLLHHMAANEDQSPTISVLRQNSELIRAHGLSPQEDDNITLTEDVTAIKENLSNWVIKQSLGWLCLLHDTPGAEEQWRQAPEAMARQQLENFEHSPCLTFLTTLLLTTTASACKDKPRNQQNPDNVCQSSQFLCAAGEFQNWQNRLNSDGKLKTRVEAASTLGGPQKHPKTQWH